MRQFEYYLFENFDADAEAGNPHNPRNFLGSVTDVILGDVARHSVNTCGYVACCEKYGVQLVEKLMAGGVLRCSGQALVFGCPVFLREDADALHSEIAARASALADLLEGSMNAIRTCCAKVDNGFPVALNLYHILCGMVFDGRFFDYLSSRGVLATSGPHASGLDYLTVIYEKCEALQTLSAGLLCSYNRFVNESCSLQSFGDANGNRLDFYRFFRLLEQGKILHGAERAERLLHDLPACNSKDFLLEEAVCLVQTGSCHPTAMSLLEHFGYVRNGAVCVPVYTPRHQGCIVEAASIVEGCLGAAMCDTLTELAESMDISAVRHGVSRLEIANELYHIVFGKMNEELVTRGIVEAPKDIPGEGRYHKCIEVYV